MLKNNSYKEIVMAASVLAVCLVIFFGNAIFTGKALVAVGNIFVQPFYRQYAPSGFTRAPNILLDDQHVQFYPEQKFAAQYLQKGQIPLWNPYILLGIPVNGTAISAIFYPWNLFAVFLPLTVILWLRPFLNFWVAGFFTFLFVRRIGGSLTGAYLSAISFMFCGFLVVWMGHPHVNAAVWLPVLLYLSELFISVSVYRKIYALLAAVVFSFVFFAGHMETAFEVCLAWFLFYMVRCFQVQGKSRIVGNFFIAVAVVILGVLLAAVQILPFLEWLKISAEFAKRSAVAFSFFNPNHLKQLPSLIALCLPNFLINPSQIDFPFICRIPWGNFNETAIYLGILPLIMGIQGAWIKNDKRKLILFFMGGGLFFLCLAFRLPVFNWINQLPIFNIFASGRWRLVFDLCMAVAAGLSLDAWFNQLADNKKRFKTLRFLLISGILAVIAVKGINFMLTYFREPLLDYGQAYAKIQYLASPIHSRPLDQVLADVPILFDRILGYFSFTNWRLYFPGIVMIAAAGLIIAWGRKWIKSGVFKYGVVGLTFLDLCVFGIGYNPVISPKDVYPQMPAIEFLKKDQSIFRILPVRSEWGSNGPLAYNLNEMGGADLPTKYYDEFTDAIDGKDTPGFIYFNAQSANSKLIDLLNVKYIVTTNKFNAAVGRDIRLCWQKDDVYIYENHQVLPRAFIVHKARVVPDDKLIPALKEALFDPASEVLLKDKRVVNSPGKEYSVKGESVDILSYTPQRVTLRTKASAGSILVISDAYYPGWRAYLDKQEIEIHRANGVMRAIEIPKGEHEIEFCYRPTSIYLGAMISAGVFLLIIVGIAVMLLSKKNK